MERTWKHTSFKVLRWFLFIPLTVVVSLVLVFLFSTLVSWVLNLHLNFWLLVAFLIFGWGLLWAILKLISAYLVIGLSFLCPNVKMGAIILSIVWTIVWLILILSLWYNHNEFLLTSITSILAISLWFSMINLLILRKSN